MKISQLLLAGIAAMASAGVVALTLATCRQPAAGHVNRASHARSQKLGSRQPIVVGQSLASPSAAGAQPSSPGSQNTAPARADDAESRGLDEFPTISDLDKDHPGISDAYREASDTAMASSLARAQRRCFRQHARDQRLIEWTGLQTFTVDATGYARLSGLELIPSTPGIQPLLDCISRDQLGKLAFRVPEGTPTTFAVREGGGRLIRSSPTATEVTTEVATLTQRLTATNLSPSQRSLLEQHLALYRCFAENGLEAREKCQHDLDGE